MVRPILDGHVNRSFQRYGFSGIARVAELGGQAGGLRVWIRGANVFTRDPKDWRHIDSESEGGSMPQKLTNFRWPYVASECSDNVNLSSKNYNWYLWLVKILWQESRCVYAVFRFESELIHIKLTDSGFKSSAVGRKLCNLHTDKFSLKSIWNLLFHSNLPNNAPKSDQISGFWMRRPMRDPEILQWNFMPYIDTKIPLLLSSK